MKKYEKKCAVKDITKRKIEMSEEQQIYLESIKREKVKVNSIRVLILMAFIILW